MRTTLPIAGPGQASTRHRHLTQYELYMGRRSPEAANTLQMTLS